MGRGDECAFLKDVVLPSLKDVAVLNDAIRPRDVETTAMGAAFAAGLAVGVWGSTDALLELNGADKQFDPAIGAAACASRSELAWSAR